MFRFLLEFQATYCSRRKLKGYKKKSKTARKIPPNNIRGLNKIIALTYFTLNSLHYSQRSVVEEKLDKAFNSSKKFGLAQYNV